MRVKFFATYRSITGCMAVEVDAPRDVLALLEELSRRWPGLREKVLNPEGDDIGADAIILVNGRSTVHLDGAATTLGNEDTVAVFPLVAGG